MREALEKRKEEEEGGRRGHRTKEKLIIINAEGIFLY